MSEPADAGATARLNELAKVTTEYAACARAGYGWSGVVGGACALAVLGVDLATGWRWTPVLYLSLPTAWLVLVRGARDYYQRHGTVVEFDAPGPSRLGIAGFTVSSALVLAAFTLRVLAEVALNPDDLAGPAFAMAAASLVAVPQPILFASVVRSRADAARANALITMVPGMLLPAFPGLLAGALAIFHWLLAFCLACAALVSIVQGWQEHARYRAVERRLAALRESA